MDPDNKKKILVLAVETSSVTGGFSILQNNEVLDHYEFAESEVISQLLLPKISEVIDKNKIILNDIDLLAVSTGPGSLTGIRVGIAIIKGLAFCLKKASYGITIFESMRHVSNSGQNCLMIISISKNRYLWKTYDGRTYSNLFSGDLSELEKHILLYPKCSIICDFYASDNLKQIVSSNMLVAENLSVGIGLKAIEDYQRENTGNLLVPERRN